MRYKLKFSSWRHLAGGGD